LKALEIAPLKDKKLTVIIIEKEYNEPFWTLEPTRSSNSGMLQSLFKPSVGFHEFMENMVKRMKPDFVTEELGMRTEKEFFEDNVLAQLFKKDSIPYFYVDIDENAKAYLATSIDKKRELRDGLLKTLAKLPKQKGVEDAVKEEYLVAYGQCLQLELEEQEKEIAFPVRESWFVMGILDHVKEAVSKEEATCFHLSSPEHVEGIKKLLESVDVQVETLKLSKEIVSMHTMTPHTDEITNLLESMQIQVKPVVKKSSEAAPFLLFYLDTDEKASPFDICMAYDAGYDAVTPYERVTLEDARRIVQDAIFSRGPKAVKHTCFFIGGKSVEKAEEVFEVVRDAMFPPFKTSIVVDPSGAYTTAAAMVAKVEDALSSHNLGSLKDKTCAVLGTGAVGQIAAVLLAKLGCNVMIASLNPKRTDGKEYAESIAKLLAEKHGVQVQGIFASTTAEKLGLFKKADVVLCAGTRGARIIEKELFKQLKLVTVLADINAIPPFGVEGMELKDDMREIAPGIFGIGALTIGDLKHKLEREILRESRSNGKETYNYSLALQIARRLLQRANSFDKLALTLSYPSTKKETK
jgi:methylene-tetrahydromethanopterin dehydrogenase